MKVNVLTAVQHVFDEDVSGVFWSHWTGLIQSKARLQNCKRKPDSFVHIFTPRGKHARTLKSRRIKLTYDYEFIWYILKILNLVNDSDVQFDICWETKR